MEYYLNSRNCSYAKHRFARTADFWLLTCGQASAILNVMGGLSAAYFLQEITPDLPFPVRQGLFL